MKKLLVYANLFAYVVVVMGLVGLANFMSARHYKRIDLTETGRYTLSTQTMKALKNLKQKVKATVFMKDDPAYRVDPQRLLEQYEWAGANFTWEFVDPDKKPNIAQKYEVTRYNTYVVETADGKRETFAGSLSEETLTNAVIKVVSEKKKKAYFSTGYGEKDINGTGGQGYSTLVEAMEKENFEVADVKLFAVDRIPEDATILIVAGPAKDIAQSELNKIEVWLRGGGMLIFMADPYTIEGGEAVKFIEKFGIRLNDDIIIDRVSKTIGGDYLAPTSSEYGYHRITKEFKLMTIYPLARSLKVVPAPEKGIVVTPLAKSRKDAWGETNREDLTERQTAKEDEGEDSPGPLLISAVVEIEDVGEKSGSDSPVPLEKPAKGKVKKGALVVIGDSDFVANAYARLSGNMDFFLNAANWLARDENLISIRPKEEGMDPIMFTVTQFYAIIGLSVVGLPAIVLVAGIITSIRRKRS